MKIIDCVLLGLLFVIVALGAALAGSYADNASLRISKAELEAKVAGQKLQIVAHERSITDLKTAVKDQNLAIEQWKSTAERNQLAANEAATTRLKDARAAAARDRTVAANPEAMNQWFVELFASP